MIRSFEGTTPEIADSAYIDETATLIGDVTVEANASVWPNTTLRGDSGAIRIGEYANIQDNAVLHGQVVIERRGAVGHGGVVNGGTVGEEALVGMNAVVLEEATIGDRSIVGAGSVVTAGTTVQQETLVVGAPAEPKKRLKGDETRARATYYSELSKRHTQDAKTVDDESEL